MRNDRRYVKSTDLQREGILDFGRMLLLRNFSHAREVKMTVEFVGDGHRYFERTCGE